MNNFWSKICEVSIWGCLPCFVLIIFALVIIISWNAEKNGIVDNEESIANNRIQKSEICMREKMKCRLYFYVWL